MAETAVELLAAARRAQANVLTGRHHRAIPRSRRGRAHRFTAPAYAGGATVRTCRSREGTCAEAAAADRRDGGGRRDEPIVEVLTIAGGASLTTCCGGCRQRIAEFAGPDTPVHAAGPDGVRRTFTLAELLPAAFGPANLAQTESTVLGGPSLGSERVAAVDRRMRGIPPRSRRGTSEGWAV